MIGDFGRESGTNPSDGRSIQDILLGLEVGFMAQDDVVKRFKELIDKDPATAVDFYTDFVNQLEIASHGGDAQIRSLVGGPDFSARAELMDAMVANYATASDDVKEKIIEVVSLPILKDNIIYGQFIVADMKNPFLSGDMLRKHPLLYPGFDCYEQDLHKSGSLNYPATLIGWMDKLNNSLFAATSVALQKDYPYEVSAVINDPEKQSVFQAAAHVVAARHDWSAERKVRREPTLDKEELLTAYRADFVSEFVDMIQREATTACWLPGNFDF